MFSRWILAVLAPLVLAMTLGACNDGVQPGVVQSTQGGYRGETGRVIAIHDVGLRGGGSGMNDGTLVGGADQLEKLVSGGELKRTLGE